MRRVVVMVSCLWGVSCAAGDAVSEPGAPTSTARDAGQGGATGSGGAATTGAGGAGGASTTGAGGAGGASTTGAGGAGGASTTGAGGAGGASTTGAGGAGGASTTGAGGAGGAPEDAGVDPPDAAANPCAADECFLAGACVEAGAPSPGDPCKACLPLISAVAWSVDAANVTCDGAPYWMGVARPIAKTPYGHATAVSCHNCYAAGLAATLAKVHAAQADGADLVELDLKDEGGAVYVQHDDDGTKTGPALHDVLADAALKAGDQLLYLEIKETQPTEAFLSSVLGALKSEGYGTAARPVVLRAFDAVSANLLLARRLLATAPFAALRPHVRLQVLFTQADALDVATLQARIVAWRGKGAHGVELEYQSPNLFGGLVQARLLDMGTNVFTVPVSMGEVFVANLRDQVDAVTVEYPVAKSRAVITDANALAYFDTWDQDPSSPTLRWFRANAAPYDAPVGGVGQPSWAVGAAGSDLVGTVLAFDASKQQSVALYDADPTASGGYFVAVAAHFDDVVPADGQTVVLLGKADAGAFSLEVANPAGGGDGDAVLRFGVHVSGSYRYATWPASSLKTSRSYLITGAYDGDGSVWLWVDNSSASTTPAGPFVAGVTPNDSPILAGADPQGAGAPRYHFSGRLQMALVQRWANH